MKKILFEYENEPMSGLTHFIGFLLAIAGLVVLVVYASLYGTMWHVVGFTIFGASMVLLYLASTLYHFFPINTKAKNAFQRVDHAMIYMLIAGTYTPVCLVTLRGPWGWSLFGVVWGLALIGILWKAFGLRFARWLSTLLYVVLGWLVMIAFAPLWNAIPHAGFMWLIAGGVFYTAGALIFSFDHIRFHKRWFGMHEIWHLFVMAGSSCHFIFMLKYVL